MSKKERNKDQPVPQSAAEADLAEERIPQKEADETPGPLLDELERLKDAMGAKEEQYLRLAAEYDNFRKRSQKEKVSAYADAKADVFAAFLPVYDNLERALKQESTDEAYKKGVEMTMVGLKECMEKLGITPIPALGEPFDPNFHNAVMHVEDDSAGESTVVEVFQAGFQLGDKVIRFAMVKVAN